MNKPEIKNCPICGKQFECKVYDIKNCQCYGINLNDFQRSYVKENYGDCLCRGCLEEIKLKKTERK